MKNESSLTAPPRAALVAVEGDQSTLAVDAGATRSYIHESKGRQLVTKVNTTAFQFSSTARLQFPGQVFANGPVPIPPGKTGWATQDWPARLLVLNSDTDDEGVVTNDITELAIGDELGPSSAVWGLTTAGNAFRLLGFDLSDTRIIKGPSSETYRICWVHPGLGFAPDFRRVIGVGSIAAGGSLTFDSQQNFNSFRSITVSPSTGTASKFVIAESGIYLVGIGANRLRGDTDEDATILELSLYNNGMATGISASRLSHVTPDDEYHGAPFNTAENVATSNIYWFEAGDELELINASSVAVSFSTAWMWVMRQGPRPQDESLL